MLSHSLPHKARAAGFFPALIQRFIHRDARLRSRRQLAVLDDHLLADIGLNRQEALLEATRTDWNAPDHWYR
jgi:uncharacterized protein YjiS (DUF1127 family)